MTITGMLNQLRLMIQSDITMRERVYVQREGTHLRLDFSGVPATLEYKFRELTMRVRGLCQDNGYRLNDITSESHYYIHKADTLP